MMPEMLMPFCHTGGSSRMETPYSKGNYTYASNGFLIIRVPRISGVEREDGPNGSEGLFEKPEPDGGWVNLSDVDLGGVLPCPKCHGAEQERKPCPECHGEGVVSHWTRFHDYEWNCKTCEGEGTSGSRCQECENSGEIDAMPLVEIAGLIYSTHLIRPFAALPNARLAKRPESATAWIKFDGGDGVVMPRTSCNR